MVIPGQLPARYIKDDAVFKLPFNELLAGLSAKQKQFDEVDDTKNKIFDDLLKVQPYFEPHKQYVQQAQNKLSSDVDNIINKYQGDLTKARPEIQRLAREINQELTTGNLATINASTKAAQEYLKEKQALEKDYKYSPEFDMALSSGKGFNELSQLPYEQAIQDGKLKGFNYTGIHTKADELKETDAIFSKIKPDADDNKWFNPKTGNWTSRGVEEIGRKKIYNAATANYDALTPNMRKELDYRFDNATKEELLNNAANYYRNTLGNDKDKDKKFIWEKELEEDLKTKDLNYFKEIAKRNYVGEQGEKYLMLKTKNETMPYMDWIKFQKEQETQPPILQPLNPTKNPNQVTDFTGGKLYVDKFGKVRVKGEKEKTEELTAQVDMTDPARAVSMIKEQFGDGYFSAILSFIPEKAVSLQKGLLKTLGFFFEKDKEIEATNPNYSRVEVNLRNRGVIPENVSKGSKEEKEIVSEFINSRVNGSVNAIGDFRVDPKFMEKFNTVFFADKKGEAYIDNTIAQTFKFRDENNKLYSGKVFGETFKGKPVSYGASINDINSPYEYGSTAIFVSDEDDTKAPLKQFIMEPDLSTKQTQSYFLNRVLAARHGLDVSEFELPTNSQSGLPAGKYSSEIEVLPDKTEVFKITLPNKQVIKYKQEGQELVKIK